MSEKIEKSMATTVETTPSPQSGVEHLATIGSSEKANQRENRQKHLETVTRALGSLGLR